MATESQVLLNIWKMGGTVYQWNSIDPDTGRLRARVVNEIPRKDDDTQPIDAVAAE